MLDLESLFKLSYAMCIAGSKKADGVNGCIVNTVFQLVPEPPMVAMSLNRRSLTHEYILDSGIFTVSIISEKAPMRFIGRFGFRSGRDTDKFEQVNHTLGLTGGPIVLDNTVAFLEVEVVQSIDICTHTLFIGKIVACETLDEANEPLTYAYYRDIKHGRTPETAATFIKPSTQKQSKERAREMKKYKCLMCGYVYAPEAGDPDGGIKPGTAFEDLPDDWVCPDCGVGKDEFDPVDE